MRPESAIKSPVRRRTDRGIAVASAVRVQIPHRVDALPHFRAQLWRLEHFDFGAVLEDIHHQLGILAVGHAQQVIAVVVIFAALLGMPGFA